MANGGIIWFDWLLNLAVRAMYTFGELIGITYEEKNASCVG
jgi:hypothetical protein